MAFCSQASGALKVQVCSDSVMRVLHSPTSSFPKRPDFVVLKENWRVAKWTMQSSDGAVTLTTALLEIVITRKDGDINYAESVDIMQDNSNISVPLLLSSNLPAT